jgi:hypothetical protein
MNAKTQQMNAVLLRAFICCAFDLQGIGLLNEPSE